MEKILLALIINHPELYDEFGEHFVNLEFQTPEYEHLRQRVTNMLSHPHEALPTGTELRRHLSASDDRSILSSVSTLEEILSNDIYMHAKGAKTDATPQQTRNDWLGICGRLEQDRVRAEYALACANYREHPTEENHRRMEALRSRMMLAVNEDSENIATQ